MILDTQEQKDILLQLIESGNYPGAVLEKIVDLKKSIKDAEIEK